jgi:autotransporter-associated beta strand protein
MRSILSHPRRHRAGTFLCRAVALVTSIALVGGPSAEAALLAGWDFQTTTNGGTAVAASPATPKVFVSNFGSGTFYLDGSNGSSDWFVPAAGSTNTELNAFGGTITNTAGTDFSTTLSSPAALALVGGATTGPGNLPAANGKFAVFSFNMSGYQDLVVSYASQRTSTGFTSQIWEYSADGVSWNSAQTVTTIASSFGSGSGLTTLNTITGLNNVATAYLRLSGTGATAASGNNRYDNIQFNASTYTPPSGTATWTGDGSGGTWANGTQGHFAAPYAGDLGTTVIFTGVGETVTVSGAVQAGKLFFEPTSGTYSVTGGTSLELGVSTNVSVAAGSTATVTTPLVGANGLIKGGTGTLILGGANTFTGGVTVSQGTLQVASDAALGDAANSLTVAGTFQTTGNLTLGAGRTLLGAGTLDIAPGTTLTVSGSSNLTGVSLPNSGTLDLQGPTRTAGGITFGGPSTITGAGSIGVTAIAAGAVTSGTAVIGPAVTFAAGERSIDVGAGGTVLLAGPVDGGGGSRLVKTGAGTLLVPDSNTSGSFRIGVSGATPTNGGTVILGSQASSGTAAQIQLNYGTLQTATAATFANGLSIGGRSNAVAVLGGTEAMTFSGSTGFFRGTSTSGELRLDVNNTSTIAGTLGPTGGGGSATGVTIGGTGRLIITANGSTFTDKIQVSPGATVEIAADNALGGAKLDPSAGGTFEFSVPAATVGGLVGGGALALQTNASAALALTVSPTSTGTFSGILSGAGSLTKTGAGTLRLTGANTYSGTTAIAAGTLLVNGDQTAAAGAVTVLAGGTLGGTGVVGGQTTIESAATLSPGNSPGTLGFAGGLTWNSGGNYDWQMLSSTGNAGAGNTWDLVTAAGALTIAATSADPFKINLWSLSSIGPDVSGDATNFDPNQSYSWRIASAAGGISGFAADKFLINTSAANGAAGFSNTLAGGTFSLSQSGTNLNLVFTSSAPPAITIDVVSGTQTQTAAGYPLLSGATPVVKTGAGTLVVDQANTLTGSTTVQGGVLRLANASALSASKLVVVAGGTGQLAPQAVTSVAGLDLATGNGLMDVTSGALTITAGMTAPQLVAELLEGRGDGSWTGTSGITSSTAAAESAVSIPRAVGWLDNGDGSLTVAYAAPGDTNLDWSIDILDASNFLAFGKFDTGSPATWIEGDFSYDGIVDILDAADFFSTGLYDAGNYNSASGASGVAAVPEPTVPGALALAAAAAAVALRRRRRS